MPYARGHRPQAGAWTETEDATLIALYGSMPAREIGAKLGRSENSVWLRARQLGFEKRRPVAKWTDVELAELKRCYAIEPISEIATRLGRTPSAVQQQARTLGLLSRKTLVNEAIVADYFHDIDSTEKAYILGLLAADGCVGDDDRVTLGLQARDEHLVRFVRDRIAPQHLINTSRNQRGYASFSVMSRSMAGDLSRWGIVPRKSRILKWPSLGEFQRPYLLGYFDGDGSACKGGLLRRYPMWSVCSGSRQFLVDLKDYVESATGVRLEKIHTRQGTSLHQVATTGRGAYIIDKWLHQDGLGLARKRYAPEIIERYENSPPERLSSWQFTPEFKAQAVQAILRERRRNGVQHGDVTRVAERLGIDRANLYRWVKQYTT